MNNKQGNKETMNTMETLKRLEEMRGTVQPYLYCNLAIDKSIKIINNWYKLFNWLNDMRFAIAPDETTPEEEIQERLIQVELLDEILNYMIEKE